MERITITDRLLQKAAQNKTPLNGSFEITADCNFACKMCNIHNCSRRHLQEKNIRFAEWKRLFDEAEEMMLFYVLLTGGEPLVHPEFADIYCDIMSRGMLTILNTNGYLIDTDTMMLFKKYPPARINVSLYGASDRVYQELCGVRDGFSVVSRNIDKLIEAGFSVKINMTVVRSNLGETDGILRFAKERNLEVRPTTYVFNTAENCIAERLAPEEAARAAVDIFCKTHSQKAVLKKRNQMQLLLDTGNRIKQAAMRPGLDCHAGTSSYWVHCDGKFGFCGMGQMKNEPNVFEVGLKKAWETASVSAANYVFPEKCASCSYRYVCHRCYAMLETDGKPTPESGDTYTCRYYKAYVKELLKKGDCLNEKVYCKPEVYFKENNR